MRRVSFFKKLSVFLLIAVMVIGASQVGVSAKTPQVAKSGCRKVTCEVRYFSADEKKQDRKPLYGYSAPVYMAAAGAQSGEYTCYSHLNKEQKSIYDKILAGFNDLNDYFLIAKGTTNENLVNDFKIVYVCIANDHPEIFWLGTRFGVDVDVWSNGTYDYYAAFEYAVASKGELKTKKEALTSKVNAIVAKTSGMTDFEKEIYFHDYLCNNIKYDFDDWECYTSYGALVNGISVCEGYAESMKMLCNACGIECLLVRGVSTEGEDHMWNMIKLPTGWYELDITWDDYKTGIIYNFFNLNDTEMNTSHIKSANYTNETIPDDLGTNLDFNYYLPSTAHPEGNGGSLKGNITSFGNENEPTEIQVYLKDTDKLFTKLSLTGNRIAFETKRIPAGEYTVKVVKKNHATFTVSVKFTNLNLIMNIDMHLLGDINGDKFVDKKDLNALKAFINESRKFNDYEKAVFDFNGDGYADKKDLNRLKKHINETQLLW